MSDDEARAWSTRQLGRILFLWFLQSKQWLGYDWLEQEASKYLLTPWNKRGKNTGGYYNEFSGHFSFQQALHSH
jgi:hypothetical protein